MQVLYTFFMENKMKIDWDDHSLVLAVNNTQFRIRSEEWKVQKEGEEYHFFAAKDVTYERYTTSVSDTLSITFRQIVEGLSVCVNVIYDRVKERFLLKLVPLEDEVDFEKIVFPGEISYIKGKLVLPYQQGVLLDTEEEGEMRLPFGGEFCSCDAYMNCMGLYSDAKSYFWIQESDKDSWYQVTGTKEHTIVLGVLASLSRLRYERSSILYLYDCCVDYNEMARTMRAYLEETGPLLTLREKVERKPALEKLIGSCVYHGGIHSLLQEDSIFYHSEGENEAIVPIKEIERNLRSFHEQGVSSIHLHLDGCGIAYDNEHPTFYPLDERTGGYPALRHLMEMMQENGDLFTIHDNYHDLYYASKDFAEEMQIYDKNGEPFTMARWAGGKQSYLTGQFAPTFLKRNLDLLKEEDIVSDGVYCDVFTCNPLDENYASAYRMTRSQCAEWRNRTFDELNIRKQIVSSEEVNLFAINHMDTCHYAPYPFMMTKDGKQMGLPIPFWNLVCHDCMIIPWMSNVVENIHYGLYGLLNGGIAYLKRDGAYVNVDGSFSSDTVDEERLQIVAETSRLHKEVAYERMLSHAFVDGDPNIQRTVFSNGTTVTINLKESTYQIVHE